MMHELLSVLGRATVMSSAAVLLILLLRKPMRLRFGAGAAYRLWILVPLAGVAALLPAPVASISMPIMPMIAMPLAMPIAAAAAAPSRFDSALLLGVLWLLGSAIALVLFVWQQQRFVRALGRLSRVGERTLRAEASAGCPALIGAWRPRIVLPVDFEERYSATERELILAHEHAHRVRGDAQANVLAAGLRCVFWFNPLVHLAASRFRFDQELACDANVISRFPEARRSYADAMLKTQLADSGLPAGCHWQSSHPLKERITMLKQPLPGRLRAALGAVTAFALIVSVTYAAWAVQPTSTGAEASTATVATNTNASYRRLSRIDYPATAIVTNTDGVVYVKLHVAVDGTVVSAVVDSVHPSSATDLAEAAVAGVRTWTFNPALHNGQPWESDEVVPIAFTLKPQAQLHLEGGTLDAIMVMPPEAAARPSPRDASPAENLEYRKTYPPKYPLEAIKAHQQGKIVLAVHVDADGAPESAEVHSAEPPEAAGIFGDASITAAMQWRFNPAMKNGKAIAGDVMVPFEFSLRDMD